MRFVLTLGKNALIVPALILPPVIMTAILVLLLEYVVPLAQLGDWAVVAISIGFFAVVALLTLTLVGSTSCKVEIKEEKEGLSFHFLEKNLFHRNDFSLSFPEILNIGEDNDKGFEFLRFTTTKQGYRKFHLTAEENDEAFGAFKGFILGKVAEYNSTATAQQRISNETIYQRWPMKALAVLMVVFWFAYPVASKLMGSSWLDDVKYWIVVVVSVPIVGRVYARNSNGR